MDVQPRESSGRRFGRRAVVIGAGMAGLCCARVLSERFDEVLVVDRDRLPDGPEWRRQVPQGRHQHVLLPRGARLLEGWFPGLVEDLHRGGAVALDLSRDFYWHRNGGAWRRPSSTLRSPSMSRPFLERTVRGRLEAIPHVDIRDGTAVDGLETDGSRGRITGVRLATGDVVASDLVVDATGRRAMSFGWLEELGYDTPRTTTVEVGIRYVTQVHERSTRPARAWKAAMVVGPPQSKRLAAAVPFEGDRWFVLLGGINGEVAPTDPAGALEFARSLPSSVVAEVLESSEPVEDPVVYRFPANQRRHVERLRRFPVGWVPVGDAVCTFNPLYGQGMTSAAQQAEALAEQLDRSGAVDQQFTRRYLRAVGRIVTDPWQIAVSGDFAYDGTTGPKPPGTDILNRYMTRLGVAAQFDDTVAQRVREVAVLERRPPSLLTPSILFRAFRPSFSRRDRSKARATSTTAADRLGS